jgi:pseudaminic acid cytidylyltransferase
MKIAVIPARGGSKRIPRKNIREFCGKPMIAYSILVAQNCGIFDRIIVSTDDFEIAEIAKKWGADVPFIRPPELSDDFVGTTDVVAHASEWAMKHHLDLEAICCIYATAPFLTPEDLVRGLDALNSVDCAFAFSVTEFAAPIFRSFKVGVAGGVEMFFPEHFPTRSQDLPLALHDAGQFYWGRPSSWCAKKKIFSAESKPVIIPRWRVQDIDTEDDWTRAELIASAMMLQRK